jgi:two-component system, sensor histidine kinase and response regulator
MKTALQHSNSTPDLSGVKVLLVEDNELNRKVAKGFLADTRADIAVAENGQIALQMLREHPSRYGLILMDIQMPVMDGLIATDKIRNELHLQTPIIAMTAQAMAGDLDKSLAVGMNAHITKPLDPDYLYQVLDEVLSLQDAALPLSSTTDEVVSAKLKSLTMVDTATAMRQLRVDEKGYRELVSDFIKLEDKLTELRQALKQNEKDEVRRIIHFYSPALSYIGAFGLAELAVQIELTLKDMQGEISEENYAKIVGFKQATRKLTAILKQRYQ